MKTSNHKIAMSIEASPEAAWSVIGKVSGVDEWFAPITACRVEGNKRFCSTEDGEFSEDILKVDHEARVLQYLIPTQHMLPIENIRGEMRVEEENNKALIHWSWEFDAEEENIAPAKEMLSQVGGMGLSGIEQLLNQSAAV